MKRKTTKTKTKQTTKTRTESEKWILHRGISVGTGKGRTGGEKYREEEAWLVGIGQTGRDKKWHGKQRTQRIYMYNPRMWTKGEGMLEDWGGSVEGGQREKNLENCNSIINKKYFFKYFLMLTRGQAHQFQRERNINAREKDQSAASHTCPDQG